MFWLSRNVELVFIKRAKYLSLRICYRGHFDGELDKGNNKNSWIDSCYRVYLYHSKQCNVKLYANSCASKAKYKFCEKSKLAPVVFTGSELRDG